MTPERGEGRDEALPGAVSRPEVYRTAVAWKPGGAVAMIGVVAAVRPSGGG